MSIRSPIEEPQVTHSQKATVEDADEAVDEEQEEDEEVVDEKLPWTHSPSRTGQFIPPPSLVEAGASLNDLKFLIQPRRTSGIGHKDPQLDLLLQSRLEKMQMFLWNYTKPIGACRWQAASLMNANAYEKSTWLAGRLRQWTRAYILDRNDLPLNIYGTWNSSILEDAGYSKRVYHEFPMSSKEADLERNVLAALEAVPLDAIRRFSTRSLRFMDY
ncbi:hypothetical protein K503DRAFT_765865 [Rhizopogon vinicolor AM-OR11-026]|uniref:Uncharacterized protein n=1 Tax=Rhizopogon vinicolor AM-OR11-026 TaxID=1314800 RepID=A0A1B7NF47_9AGAM|nr:hypothetical protein K503DRAFT_765865 [Rhizopogon vinicolor AM-OR11-026]